MAALAAIDDLVRMIDCALAHPRLPHANSTHKGRHVGELTGPPDVVDMYPVVYDMYKNFPLAEAFREPVSALNLGILDYYTKVPQPMCLRYVLDRLVYGDANPAAGASGVVNSYLLAYPNGTRYSTYEEVLEDLSLIWRNCERYNGPTNPVTDAAHQCEAWLIQKLEEIDNSRIATEDDVGRFDTFFERAVNIDESIADDLVDLVRKEDRTLVSEEGDVNSDRITNGMLRKMLRFVRERMSDRGLIGGADDEIIIGRKRRR